MSQVDTEFDSCCVTVKGITVIIECIVERYFGKIPKSYDSYEGQDRLRNEGHAELV